MLMLLKGCNQYKVFKAKPQIPMLGSVFATKPLDVMHINLVNMEIPQGLRERPVMKKILMVVDFCTRFAQVYITSNETTATVYEEYFFSVFGFLRKLVCDQRKGFTGGSITALCDYLNIKKVWTFFFPIHSAKVQ